MKQPVVKKLPLASVVLPGNFAVTRAADRIGELAASMEEHGVFSLPVVAWDGSRWKLIAGHDRVAAMMRSKTKQALFVVVTGDERALRRLSVAENLYRRHDDKAELLRLIDDERAAAEADLADTRPVSNPPHRPKTAKGVARDRVAKAAGKSPEAIRKQEQRARAKDDPKEDRGGAEAGEAPTSAPVATDELLAGYRLTENGFDLLNSAPDLTWLLRLEDAIASIDEADKHLRLAQGQVTQLVMAGFPNALQQRLKEEVHRAAVVVRQARPIMVCPFPPCRDAPSAADCNACLGSGYIVEQQRTMVPKEFVAAARQHFTDPQPTTPASGRRARQLGVKLVDEAGGEHDYEPVDDAEVSA